MIQAEMLNDGTLIRHYSDDGHYIIQTETGIQYTDAVDVVPCRYTYTESEELIPVEPEPTEPTEEAVK